MTAQSQSFFCIKKWFKLDKSFRYFFRFPFLKRKRSTEHFESIQTLYYKLRKCKISGYAGANNF